MRYLFIFGLCLIANSCTNGDCTHHRSYVISKSTETVEDSETVVAPPVD